MRNYIGNNIVFLRKKAGLKQEEIQSTLGFKRNTWSNWENGISEPNISTLLVISNFFKVDLTELITKDLSKNVHPFKNISNKLLSDNVHPNVHQSVHLTHVSEANNTYYNNRIPKLVTVDSQGNENVVLVPIKARAGYLNGYGDERYISQLPAYRLPGLNNGTYRLFEVEGLSMHPTFNSGDVVIGSFVESIEAVRDDRVYVVVTRNDGIVVKRVLNRIKTDGKLILKSDNFKDRDEYPTIVVSPEDVLEVWYAKSYISHQMRPPAEMYNRLIDLEGKFTLLEDKLKKINQ